jgi:hypothetical protein
MSTETPTDGNCNAETRDDGYCANPPVTGADRCRMHGGDPDAGAPVENGNAETHGLHADREAWFDRHRGDAEPHVRSLVASYMEDAPFGWEATGKVEKLVEVAIDQARLRASNEEIDEFLDEQIVGTREDGTPIVRVEQHPAHLPRDRIKRTNLRVLKDLGVIDGPDSEQADATKTIAEVLADE